MEYFVKISKWIVCLASLTATSLNVTTPLQAVWNTPVVVSDPAINQKVSQDTGPVLTVNASNNGVAVYGGSDPLNPEISSQDNIWAASYNFGNGWQTPVMISDEIRFGPNNRRRYFDQGDPDVMMNASGYTVAAWQGTINQDNFDTNEVILSATRSSTGTWSAVQVVRIGPPEDFTAQNPAVAVNNAGLGVAVWDEVRGDSETYYIMTSFLPFGESWTPAVGAINDTNDAVHAATYDHLTGVWTTVVLDADPGIEGSDNTTAITGIDENGNAVVVWPRVRSDGVYEVAAASFTYGSGWGPMVIIQSSALALDSPYVVMDHFGTSTVVWSNENEVVFASTLPLGQTWSAPTIIGQGDLVPNSNQKAAAVDDLGNVIAIFKNGTYQTALRTVQGGWQPQENIPNITTLRTISPNIGIGSCGFALSLWKRQTLDRPGPGSRSQIEASDNFSLANFLSPPANFSVSRCCSKFATQTSCIARLSWEASEGCVLSYIIRRNGVLIARIPVGGSTEYVDPVCRNQRVTYTLSAVDINGIESAGVSIISP